MNLFGEPWHENCGDEYEAVSANGDLLLMCFPDEEKSVDRAIACVNACAGLKNPASVKDVIEAAKLVVSPYLGVENMDETKLVKALSRLSEEPSDE